MRVRLAGSRVSGHVTLRDGPRGPVYYVKYRLPDGRQIKQRLGPAWQQRGRAPEGTYTARTAEEALQAILADARRGTLAGDEHEIRRVRGRFGRVASLHRPRAQRLVSALLSASWGTSPLWIKPPYPAIGAQEAIDVQRPTN